MKKILVMTVTMFAFTPFIYAFDNTSAQINADTGAGVSTSMNGNTATTSGAPISSTSSSAATRNASGTNSS